MRMNRQKIWYQLHMTIRLPPSSNFAIGAAAAPAFFFYIRLVLFTAASTVRNDVDRLRASLLCSLHFTLTFSFNLHCHPSPALLALIQQPHSKAHPHIRSHAQPLRKNVSGPFPGMGTVMRGLHFKLSCMQRMRILCA